MELVAIMRGLQAPGQIGRIYIRDINVLSADLDVETWWKGERTIDVLFLPNFVSLLTGLGMHWPPHCLIW